MAEARFSVEVLVDGRPLDRLRDDHGFFVLGRPGTRYDIRVCYRGPPESAAIPVVAEVFVDGQPVFAPPRHSRVLKRGRLLVPGFETGRIVERQPLACVPPAARGESEESDEELGPEAAQYRQAFKYRPFVFAFPDVEEDRADPELGTIRVELHESLPREVPSTRPHPSSTLRPNTLQPRQGKKAHLPTRMTTVAGEEQTTAFALRSPSATHTVFDKGEPVHTLRLRYFQDHRGGSSGSGHRPPDAGASGGRPGGRRRGGRGVREAAEIEAAVRNSLATLQQERGCPAPGGEACLPPPPLVFQQAAGHARLADGAAQGTDGAPLRGGRDLEAQPRPADAAAGGGCRGSSGGAAALGPAAASAAPQTSPAAGPAVGAARAEPAAAEPAAAAAERAPCPAEPASAPEGAAAAPRAAGARPSAAAAAPAPRASPQHPCGGATALCGDDGYMYRAGPGGTLTALYAVPGASGGAGRLAAAPSQPGSGAAAASSAPQAAGQPPAAAPGVRRGDEAAQWQKYRGHGGRIWWWRGDGEWFFEDDAADWQRFSDDQGRIWWYRDDSTWFFRDTGAMT